MPLSEKEQRILDELEKQLRSDEPSLASSLAPSPTPVQVDGKRLIVGAVGVVGGLAMLVFAVSLPQIWLGVLAFVIMVAATVYAVSGSPTSQSASAPTAPHAHESRSAHPAFGSPKKKSQSSFMKKMEERWDRRSEDER